MLLCGTCLCVAAQGTTSFQSANRSVNVDEFSRKLEVMMKETGVPALSVAVIDSNKIVFSNTYGLRDKWRNLKANQRTVFEGASLTKVFLVYVVNKLVDEGRFDLDKPMYLYLRHEGLEHDQRYLKITARMILCHSSGIENWKSEHDPNVLEILHDPGTQFEYSGEGFQWLARVIERVLNEPYEKYIDEMVIKPFHLKRTFMKYKRVPFDPFERGVGGNYAIGCTDVGDKQPKWKSYIPVPASGVQTTADALARLWLGIFTGNHLSRARIDSFSVPLIETTNYGQQAGPGLWIVNSVKDSVLYFGGVNSGFRSYIFYSVKYKRGFVFQSSCDDGWEMILEINRLTACLGIEHLFKGIDFMEYPGTYVSLQHSFREESTDAFLEKVENAKRDGALDKDQLKTLADFVRPKNKDVANSITQEASARNE
jgi:CubicO group peptidase (beta-lactamase class C family)